jgi:hypothetical protein
MPLLPLLLQSVARWRQRVQAREQPPPTPPPSPQPAPSHWTPEDFLTIDEDWLRAEAEDERRQRQTPVPVDERSTDPAWQWAASGQWVHLASSNVTAIRYIEDARILEVEFHGGGVQAFYSYFAVPPEVAVGFYNADSPGRYVWRVLRGEGFHYVRISALSGARVPRGSRVIRRKLPGER